MTCRRVLLAVLFVAMAQATVRAADAPATTAPATTAPATTAPTDPTDPEVERRTFKVADGFEVNLFAAEPMIAKPIQMNFDARGRLWVASSAHYPQIKPGEQPGDQIVVLEDVDDDGRADKSTPFADDLLIPTGVEPDADGRGAFVANSTELLHVRDTDGDGRADQRKVVLSGFGTEDTHHIIHAFRWGGDGRFYFNQSVYIHSHIETPLGVRRLAGSGVWRFDSRTMQLEVFSRGMINPWGHAFDAWGQSFGTDGAGDGGIYYIWPGAAFTWAVGFERVLGGMNPGQPKYCGLEIVNGRHLPDDWQNSAITNDFRANRVVRFALQENADGAYVSKQMPDVITSTDVAFRPVDVRIGPDGAIYIADWYNPIINHGEVDFRDPRRDKTRGRIWRITAKGRPLVARPKLVGEPVGHLLEQLKIPENDTRRLAKLVLRSLGAETVTPALAQWVAGLDVNDPQREHHRLEALWTYQSLNTPQPSLLRELLESKTPQVRAAATRVIGDWLDALPDAIDLLAARVTDEHPRVRLEAVRVLARVPSPRAIEIAMRALDKPRDKDMDYALWLTARETQATWMPAVSAGEMRFGDNAAHASFALQAVKSPAAAAALAQQFREGKTPAAERGNVLAFIASYGAAEEAKLIYDVATADATPAGERAAALAALEKSARRGVAPANADAASVAALVSAKEDNVRVAAIRLAGAWRAIDVRAALMRAVDAAETPPAVRQAAIDTLVELGGESADFFRQLDAPNHAYSVRVATLVGLSALDLKDAAKRAAELLAAAPAECDPAPLVAGFLQRDGGANALASALSSKRLAPPIATAALRHVESAGRDEKSLTNYLRNAAGISVTSSKKLSKEELARRVADVQRHGDAARGEMIFRRADTSCFKCHAIQGAGGQLGPDLGSIGAGSPVDYLVESLIDPNKAIKDGYDSVIIKTKDNDVHSGIKIAQDDANVILRDAVNDRIVVPAANIRSERSGGSLMPTGLIDHLPSWEQINLLRFLAELGKPGPYEPASASIVRRWRVLPASAAEQVVADLSALQSPARDTALPWTPAYSLVSGDLPLDAMATEGQPVAFARGEIDVTAPGKIGLHIADVTGLTLWVDGAPHAIRPDLALDLPRGPHTLTFKTDVAARGQGLRVELRDVPGSPGAARPVGGR